MARQRDEKKRKVIISAATKLFAEKGYHATSIQDIVSASDLSVGTIYLYFANKEEIFNAVLDIGVGGFLADLIKQADKGLSAKDFQGIVNGLGNVIIDAIEKNINLVTVLTTELSFQEKLQSFYSSIATALSEKFMGEHDEETLYKLLGMSKKEFFAFVTIMVSGLCNAIRLSMSADSKTITKEAIRSVTLNIVLAGLAARAGTPSFM